MTRKRMRETFKGHLLRGTFSKVPLVSFKDKRNCEVRIWLDGDGWEDDEEVRVTIKRQPRKVERKP